ncbi:MAG: hypothetical protein ITG04_07840 [Proteiniphilum sp.]|nr:hypothetical protein [Proteiniphilum sp.]
MISYKTAVSPLLKTIAMDDFNFACGNPYLSRDIDVTASGAEGFQPLTPEINVRCFKIMKENVKFLEDLPQEQMDTIATWYLSLQCN